MSDYSNATVANFNHVLEYLVVKNHSETNKKTGKVLLPFLCCRRYPYELMLTRIKQTSYLIFQNHVYGFKAAVTFTCCNLLVLSQIGHVKVTERCLRISLLILSKFKRILLTFVPPEIIRNATTIE